VLAGKLLDQRKSILSFTSQIGMQYRYAKCFPGRDSDSFALRCVLWKAHCE
jgi:hypothetical protein